jgi:hypothetical protein
MVTPDIQFAGDYLPTAIPLPCLDGGPVIANLECAITDDTADGFSKAHKLLLTSEAYELVAKSGVAAFSLANNHTLDAGPIAFHRMTSQLRDRGIRYYGTMECPSVEISARSGKVAVIGCLEKCRSRGALLFPEEGVEALIKQIRNQYQRVYVTPHWGKESEFCLYPSQRIMRLAMKWMDAGADGIFGHHPHTIHGTMRGSPKPVYFSLGGYAFRHAVTDIHPVADIGLVVSVDCSTNTAKERFIFCNKNASPEVTGEADMFLRKKFEQLSLPLTTRWSAWNWARHDGFDYLSQANNSWRLRFRKPPLVRTIALWALWNLIPTTVMARLGSLYPARESTALRSELNQWADSALHT